MRKNHLIDLNDFTRDEWENVIDLACKIYKNPSQYSDACKGKILATLFYEPSTRTQMSFQSAMLRLGGNIIGFDNPQNSSVSKGETLTDTIKIISGYADIIAMRHYLEGAALCGCIHSDIPLINAGDGGHLHPTQTLTDLVTLKNELGHSFDNLTVGLCGDLKNGRTVHSLINALCHYDNVKFVLISTDVLTLPKRFKDVIENSSCTYEEVYALDEAISKLDVLYMTRIQRERFSSMEEYEAQKSVYVLDTEKLKKAKADLKILHPLPRVDEISYEVDTDPRALYFKQARYGVYARMALILTLLNSSSTDSILKGKKGNYDCDNPRCITHTEKNIPKSIVEINGERYCEYCDTKI